MKILTLAGAAGVIASLAAPADAACDVPAALNGALLAREFGEVPLWTGGADLFLGEGPVTGQITLFTAPDGGSWSLLAVGEDGASCIIASGQFWQPGGFVIGEEG
ncbi:hypothetical protein AQS8620_01437 [Aquimixticola soesokkakensis]|uniref:Uncharacterized protein n=1 Tax=Aquimixticola soesokkakensis TaxID=1519096 RepID=A0A1Y5SFC8_9RHOB|nr:hypothetical protein [Aquimixticola soesokkakensis]SLN38291.1 hypothetical protein AQS8620_01437 [Aquimixticola soesokkakensis]